MEIGEAEKPVKKMAGIGEIFDEAWELYIYNIGIFAVYMILWLVVNLLVNVIFVYAPNIIAHRAPDADFYRNIAPLLPYLRSFMFVLLAYCMCAVTRAAMMRYDGEENRYGFVLKKALEDFPKYFLVFMTLFSLVLLAWKVVMNRYMFSQFLMQVDYRLQGVLVLALLLPLFYLIIRYFPALTAALASPPEQGTFKSSSYLMKSNYSTGTLLVFVISGMVCLVFYILMMTGLLYIDNGLTMFIGLPFIVCVNVVYFRKLEEYKGAPEEPAKLRRTNPVFAILLGALMCLLPLDMVFPEVPRKIFFSSESLMAVFSNKMEFPGGLVLKRPAGWFVRSTGSYEPAASYYYVTKEGNKAVNNITVQSALLKDAVFRKDKLNPGERKKLKNILGISDESGPEMCAYQVTDTLQEMNAKGEYPKGIYIRKSMLKTKDYSTAQTTTYYYRVVRNMYAVSGRYELSDYSYQEGGDEDSKKEQAEYKAAREKEGLEADRVLREMLLF